MRTALGILAGFTALVVLRFAWRYRRWPRRQRDRYSWLGTVKHR